MIFIIGIEQLLNFCAVLCGIKLFFYPLKGILP